MATSAALDRTNLYSQVQINIFNLLNNRSNVVDPRDSTGNREFLLAHEPDFERGFQLFPVVVVNPANTSMGDLRLGDDKTANVLGEIIIEVWSTDTFFRNKTTTDVHGKGLTYLDAISDDVMQTLNSVANRNTLRANNIGGIRVETRGTDFRDLDDEKLWVREIAVTFDSRLLVVSS